MWIFVIELHAKCFFFFFSFFALYRVENMNLLLQSLTTGGSPQRGIIQPMLAILMVNGYGLMMRQSLASVQIRCCMTRRMSSSTNKYSELTEEF
jgi:hypothetical protein